MFEYPGRLALDVSPAAFVDAGIPGGPGGLDTNFEIPRDVSGLFGRHLFGPGRLPGACFAYACHGNY